MFTKLTDTSKAAIFTVLVLFLSVGAASIAHAVHNAAWGLLAAFTLTSSPVVVNEYLAGDNGVLILVGTAIAAVWLGRILRGGMNQAQQEAGTAAVVPEAPPAPAAATVPR